MPFSKQNRAIHACKLEPSLPALVIWGKLADGY